jgi:aminocarboxymuconate-semialdehyde decarboxylase
MKVDTHAHFFSRDYHERMAALPGNFVVDNKAYGETGRAIKHGATGQHVVSYNERWFERDYPIREMDAKGIDMRLLSLAPPNVYIFPPDRQVEATKRVNDETIAYCKGRTDRLRAVPSLPLTDVEASLAELDRVAGAPEVVGVAIGSNVAGVPLSDKRFEPVWARIDEKRIPVIQHPLHPTFAGDIQDRNLSVVLGFWYDTVLMVSRLILNGVFERYPNFPFLVAHTGSGLISALDRLDWASERWAKELPKPASHYAKRLYYDTCGTYGPMLMETRAAVGADRILFGTDYPYIDIDFAHVNDLEISAQEKAAINGDTAARVFGLEG